MLYIVLFAPSRLNYFQYTWFSRENRNFIMKLELCGLVRGWVSGWVCMSAHVRSQCLQYFVHHILLKKKNMVLHFANDEFCEREIFGTVLSLELCTLWLLRKCTIPIISTDSTSNNY